jgi:hypothetical protein
MIIEFCKTEKITPKGCHFFEDNHAIPSGLKTGVPYFEKVHPAI